MIKVNLFYRMLSGFNQIHQTGFYSDADNLLNPFAISWSLCMGRKLRCEAGIQDVEGRL